MAVVIFVLMAIMLSFLSASTRARLPLVETGPTSRLNKARPVVGVARLRARGIIWTSRSASLRPSPGGAPRRGDHQVPRRPVGDRPQAHDLALASRPTPAPAAARIRRRRSSPRRPRCRRPRARPASCPTGRGPCASSAVSTPSSPSRQSFAPASASPDRSSGLSTGRLQRSAARVPPASSRCPA